MTAWSLVEIQAEIQHQLPAGWKFTHYQERSGFWKALIGDFTNSDEPVAVWEDENPDERLLLFNAFSWLWLKKQPPTASSSRWQRRRELSREAVTKLVAMGKSTPDPEDLDPDEVASVYKDRRNRR